MFRKSPTTHSEDGLSWPEKENTPGSHQLRAMSYTGTPVAVDSPGQFSHALESMIWISPEQWWKPKNLPGKVGTGSSLLLMCVTCPPRWLSTQLAKSWFPA